MQTVQVTGKSLKGKNRVREAKNALGDAWDGSTWAVLESRGAVAFSSRRGMWLHVCPLAVPAELRQASDLSRWMLRDDDEHFTVVSA